VGLLAALGEPGVDPDEVRRTVDEVLARPEYQPLEPGLLDRLLAYAAELIGRVLEAITAAAGGNRLIGGLIVAAVLGAVVALGVRLSRGLRPDPSRAVVVGGAVGRPPAAWEEEAAAHERAGRWREALRSRYRKLLAGLAAAGLIDEVPGRTSGEYLREALQALPAAGDDLRAVTRAFEAAWYGDRPVSAAEVADVRARVERALAARDRPAPVPAGAA
jgi:hypothetical protein